MNGLRMMFLSVIIPTRNRAKYLACALESLTKQTYPFDMYEVLVIDNGSTDNTREVCTSFKNGIPQLRYFYEEKPGLHVGRHLGMKMAKSENLVYADDDIEAFPTWLEGIVEAFTIQHADLVGGKCLPNFEQGPPSWLTQMWEGSDDGTRILWHLSIIDLGNDIKEIDPLFVFGCNFAVRKSVLFEAGGFHPDSFPSNLIRYRGDGESAASRYIGTHRYRAIYHPKASVLHSIPSLRMTEEYFCKRAYQQGISDSYTCIRTSENLSWIRKLKRLVQKHIPFLNRDSFNKKLQTSYWQGYDFHQSEVKKDPSLYKWVMQKEYF